MTHKLETRVRKLEAERLGPERMHIIPGHSQDEFARKQAALIASGTARPSDFFVMVRRFAEAA